MQYPYNNYYPQDQLTQLRQQQYPQQQYPPQSGIIWVQGEEAAKAYMVAAGNSVLLMDAENSTFYIKATDISGMPQPLRTFDYTERSQTAKMPSNCAQTQKNDNYVTRAEFDELRAIVGEITAKEIKDDEPSV